MLDKIKSAAKAVADIAGDTVGAGFEKVKGPLNELSAGAPDLERVGYRVGEIEVVLTLPPRLVLYLSREAPATEEAFQALLANYANNQTMRTVSTTASLRLGEALVLTIPERLDDQGRAAPYEDWLIVSVRRSP